MTTIWHVLRMIHPPTECKCPPFIKKETYYEDCSRHYTEKSAIESATNKNTGMRLIGRYFVVSEEEYQGYWKGKVS